MRPPEPCLKGRCFSPTSCNDWGYCRERNMDDPPRLTPWDVVVERRRIAAERKANEKIT